MKNLLKKYLLIFGGISLSFFLIRAYASETNAYISPSPYIPEICKENIGSQNFSLMNVCDNTNLREIFLGSLENDKNKERMETENPKCERQGCKGAPGSSLKNECCSDESANKNDIDSVTFYEVENGYECGLSGSFVGRVGERLIQAGGCNFPVDPLAPQSQKKFYQGIYEMVCVEDGKWSVYKIGDLKAPIAYGSGVTIPDGLLLIGGSDAKTSFRDVYILKQGEGGKVIIEEYPSLPVSVDNAYATYWDGTVYVAGGNMNGEPSVKLYALELNNLEEGWKELPSFPGNQRVQPVMAAAQGKDGNDYIYIWGGFAPKGGQREASLNTDGVRFNINSKKWESIPGPVDNTGEPLSVGGGTIATLTDGRFVVTGGVNKDVFIEALRNQAPDYLSHPIEWYRFNPFVLVYDPKDNSWSIKEETSNTARAGAGMISTDKDEIIVVGGELKPRIRTAEIYKTKIDK